MNWAMLGEFVLAVLVTQMDAFNRVLGTVQINLRQFGWALVPAVALLALWEIGKLIARRSASRALPLTFQLAGTFSVAHEPLRQNDADSGRAPARDKEPPR